MTRENGNATGLGRTETSDPSLRYETGYIVYREHHDGDDPVYGIARCLTCGALVADAETHSRFHLAALGADTPATKEDANE